jgi:hypothetical protein
MKQSEAVRIPALLAARQPAPVVEEAVVEGIRMLVIMGNEVDTVIQYTRGGGAKMPQLSSYDEVAEEAARADVLLAKQRASGRRNTTGEGVHWPSDWKLAKAKATGKIWYATPGPERGTYQKPSVPTLPDGASTDRSTVPTLDSTSKINSGRRRLANAVRALTQIDEVRLKLEELKKDARYLQKPHFLWLSLVESMSSMGNSRGYDGLFRDPANYERITFEALSLLSPEERFRELARTLSTAAVRMPDRKAEWLVADFDFIQRIGGPAKAKDELLNQPGRDAKVAFLKRLAGIGDKYARNIFMNVYHPEFRQSIAVDSRIESVLEALGLNELKNYEAREQFLVEAAKEAGVDGWDLDRMLYNFKDQLFARL